MSEASDPSDTEASDKQDDKDTDFNVDDYCREIDSDDSFAESVENNVNVRPTFLPLAFSSSFTRHSASRAPQFHESLDLSMFNWVLSVESVCLVTDKIEQLARRQVRGPGDIRPQI